MRDTQHLVNTSTIIQFGDWSKAGFEYMAKKYFANQSNQLKSGTDDNSDDEGFHVLHLDQIVLVQIEMHHDCEIASIGYQQETGHFIYISPQLFENFIRNFKQMLKSREIVLVKHQ